MAAPRRPKPEGFDENLDELVACLGEREALNRRIDELFIAVADGGPISTVAERLNVGLSSITDRRAGALRRQRQRSEDQTTRAA